VKKRMRDKRATREWRFLFALAVVGALAFLSGCASSPITFVESKDFDLIDDPEVGKTVTRGLGERLVAKGIRTTGPAMQILEATQFNKKEGEGTIMTCAVTVLPGSVFKRGIYSSQGVQADCYGPVNYQLTHADGTTNFNCRAMGVGDICKLPDGGHFLTNGIARFKLEQDYNHLKVIEKLITDETNFVQELIYNGRISDNLKFVYREFSNEMARPAFTQEVQYDLATSNIIGFKKLRMTVIEATNTEITYRLDKNFE